MTPVWYHWGDPGRIAESAGHSDSKGLPGSVPKMEEMLRLVSKCGRKYFEGTGVPKGGGLGVQTPPKFRSFEKDRPNSQFRGIYICNNLIRIRVSLIYKLSETPKGGYCPQIPILSALCPQLNLLNPPQKNSWLRYCSRVMVTDRLYGEVYGF
jgi:hypothetical protein